MGLRLRTAPGRHARAAVWSRLLISLRTNATAYHVSLLATALALCLLACGIAIGAALVMS